MTRGEAVIVVAGGRSTRFGSDKLRHVIDGRTLLERTVDAARGADVVVLVSASETPEGVYIAVSENPRWGGPCAAVAAGVDALAASPATDVLILAADLANPASAISALRSIDAGVLTDADGSPQWLLARSPRAVLERRIAELRGERGALDGLPASALLGVVDGRHRAPADVHADIDSPADLPSADRTASEERTHGTV